MAAREANADLMPLMSKRVSLLLANCGAYFSARFKLRRILPGAETIFICQLQGREAEQTSSAKCPGRYGSPGHSFPSSSYSSRAWLETRRYFEMDRIVDFGIECIAEGPVPS
jgi:hypothetical protein